MGIGRPPIEYAPIGRFVFGSAGAGCVTSTGGTMSPGSWGLANTGVTPRLALVFLFNPLNAGIIISPFAFYRVVT